MCFVSISELHVAKNLNYKKITSWHVVWLYGSTKSLMIGKEGKGVLWFYFMSGIVKKDNGRRKKTRVLQMLLEIVDDFSCYGWVSQSSSQILFFVLFQAFLFSRVETLGTYNPCNHVKKLKIKTYSVCIGIILRLLWPKTQTNSGAANILFYSFCFHVQWTITNRCQGWFLDLRFFLILRERTVGRSRNR